MATPAIVEVEGSGKKATSWVLKVRKFASSPMQRTALAVACQDKPFHLGLARLTQNSEMYLLAHHPVPISGGNLTDKLENMIRKCQIDVSFEGAKVFNIFHAELLGLREMPGPSKVEEEYYETGGESEDEAIKHCTTRKELAKALDIYHAQKEQMALALLNPQPSVVAVPASHDHGPGLKTARAEILWLNTQPAELHMSTARNLGESEKRDFVLQRLRHAEASCEPVVDTFPSFFGVYQEVSSVKDRTRQEQLCFDTFSEWVQKETGTKLIKKDMPADVKDAALKVRNGESVPGNCLRCKTTFETGMEPVFHAGNIYERKKNPYDEFCSKKCAGTKKGDFRLFLTPLCHVHPDGCGLY